ncbi:TonB-dependent receptor [Novosphingobium sp. MW5]|nr:TonB-dependent receptor [Novosphingobium sp. MW5]
MTKSRFLAGVAILTVASLPSVAFAQASDCTDANNNGTCDVDEPSSASAPAEEGAIVVTGSRIRRDQYNTADSVQIITRSESTQAGFNSTAEVLQSTKVTGGTSQINDLYGGFVVNGGPGVNTVSLRGLGTTRTLVLLNGRRISPAGSRGAVGAADLNVLPNAIIDRVEVLNTGASSIYGSDAVAGVINLVTRRDVNGIEFEAQHNILEAGAGNSRRYSVVGGFSDDRWKFTGTLEYFQRDVLEIGDREFASCPRGLYGTNGSDYGAADFLNPDGSVKCFPLDNGGVTVNTIGTPTFSTSFTSPSVFIAPQTRALAPAGTAGIQCNRFRPNASVTTGLVPGYECVGGSYFSSATTFSTATLLGGISTNIRDTFAPSMLKEDLVSPVKTYTAFGQASYKTDTLGDAEIYTEFLFTRRKSDQDGQRQFTIDYPLGSPLIPAAYRYAGSAGAATNTTNGAPIGVRVFADYGLYNNRQKVDFTRVNGGIRGDLPFGWRYDMFAMKAWSEATYTTDLILVDRLAASFDVVAAGSGFACRNAIAGCVAAPVLSPTVVGGTFPADWFDFVTDPVTGITKYTETTFAANVDGPLFDLPGGKAQLALGAEYRKASIDDTPGSDSQRNNLYGFTSSSITRGSDSVWEGFGELELPLIRDSFIHELTLNASARYTHYKSYGGEWTYKIGGQLSPISWISLRGSYGTSYRAPALFEQFLGRTSGFLSSATDPCNDVASLTNTLIKTQCLADGLAADFRQTSSVTSIGTGGAEAGLKSETSKALSIGGVLNPPIGSFGTLSISADYFDVKVNNGVARLTASQVLSQCYNSPERVTCKPELISRNAAGALTVVSSYVNISDARVKGIDYNLRFGTDLLGGKFRLNAAATMFISRYSRTFPTDAIQETIGLLLNPKWTGTFDVNYAKGPFNFRYSLEWIGATDSTDYAAGFGLLQNRYLYKTDDYFTHAASLNIEASKNFDITLGVRNIFDKEPPQISADYTNLIGNAPLYSAYDIRGRTFFVGLKAKM